MPGMRSALLLLISVALTAACTSNEEILKELEEHNITGELLTRNLRDSDAQHAFTLTSFLLNGDEESFQFSPQGVKRGEALDFLKT